MCSFGVDFAFHTSDTGVFDGAVATFDVEEGVVKGPDCASQEEKSADSCECASRAGSSSTGCAAESLSAGLLGALEVLLEVPVVNVLEGGLFPSIATPLGLTYSHICFGSVAMLCVCWPVVVRVVAIKWWCRWMW